MLNVTSKVFHYLSTPRSCLQDGNTALIKASENGYTDVLNTLKTNSALNFSLANNVGYRWWGETGP